MNFVSCLLHFSFGLVLNLMKRVSNPYLPLFWYCFVFKVLLFLVGSSTLLMYLVLTHTFTCCRPSQSTSFVHPIWPINELLDHLIAKNVQSAHVKELFFFSLLVCVHALNSLVKRWNRERILHDKDMIRNSLLINFVKLKLRISENNLALCLLVKLVTICYT